MGVIGRTEKRQEDRAYGALRQTSQATLLAAPGPAQTHACNGEVVAMHTWAWGTESTRGKPASFPQEASGGDPFVTALCKKPAPQVENGLEATTLRSHDRHIQLIDKDVFFKTCKYRFKF